MTWLSRDTVPTGTGFLRLSPAADVAVPLSSADLAATVELSRETFAAAGITATDRVVVALNSDGDLAGAVLTQALTGLAGATASVGPRGRMRLLAALDAVGATALVITPTGAADLLARLHMEFLVDPLDLGLRTLILVGEITDQRTCRHLAAEFGARVIGVYVDPVFGAALAWRDATDERNPLSPVRDGLLALADLAEDAVLAAAPGKSAELVLTPVWHSTLGDATIRTGEVVDLSADSAGIPAPTHTVGDHVLIRGRWLSLPRLRAVLAKIDGIAQWTLEIRRDGTLDVATLKVAFARPSLLKNPMWHGRVRQAVAAVTPVTIKVEVLPEVSETSAPPVIDDRRGHHLGSDRHGR
ncbi:hypothetical protein KZZ52_23575 [Dactylosporangium sp. AC04546]|uniref:hypothetical protein n=1 Tax=Dactylosporangium sp. AC04546 TaxID=2862460 RepID=UPI001EDF0CAF|nr:hypothetical protein [Dactylosporangium sp. AC04546]WVK88259.1 hypothetical protein KZZ52_23575 [Dactylosporangium sp. AC04546]